MTATEAPFDYEIMNGVPYTAANDGSSDIVPQTSIEFAKMLPIYWHESNYIPKGYSKTFVKYAGDGATVLGGIAAANEIQKYLHDRILA